MPFTNNRAQSILSSNIKNTTYIGLSTTAPTETTGAGFTEPAAATTGYTRKQIGTLNISKAAQIANEDIIFLFEAVADCGTFTHLGCFDSASGGTPFFTGVLAEAVTVPAGYVPLIRARKFVVGLDKNELEEYPEKNAT